MPTNLTPDELSERLRFAEFFFHSPNSFSNEEFQAVGQKVLGCSKYIGTIPYLTQYDLELQQKEELIRMMQIMINNFGDPFKFQEVIIQMENGEWLAKK